MSMDMESEKRTEAVDAPTESHDMRGHDHSQMKMEEAGHDMTGREHPGMNMHGDKQDLSDENEIGDEQHHHGMMNNHKGAGEHLQHTGHNTLSPMDHNMMDHDMSAATPANTRIEAPPKLLKVLGMNHMKSHDMSAATPANTRIEAPPHSHPEHHDMSHMNHGAMHNMHLPSATQPMFPTVTIAVCHCGAGCLLGDIIGEWLVFGTNATLGSKSIGPEFLIGTPSLPSLQYPPSTIPPPPSSSTQHYLTCDTRK